MLKVAHLTDGGITILEDQSNFTRREFNMGIFSLLRHQLTIGACAAHNLATLSHLQFDIVNQGPRWNVPEWKGIPRFDVSGRARDHCISHFQLIRSKDIPFFTIRVVK